MWPPVTLENWVVGRSGYYGNSLMVRTDVIRVLRNKYMSGHTVIPAQKQNSAPINSGILQRKTCSCGRPITANGECAECRKKRLSLQRRAVNQAGPEVAPPIVHEVLREPGRPLDPTIRSFMESRFNHDFGRVRVHTDSRASQSAQAVDAHAYTVGQNVVFSSGQYTPNTMSGHRLLAHELTHVVQQEAFSGTSALAGSMQNPGENSRLENEAARSANAINNGREVSFPLTSGGPSIMRDNGGSGSSSPGVRYTRPTTGPSAPDLCENKTDITRTFRDFVAAVPTHIANIPNIRASERTRLTTLANIVLHSEGAADIDNFTIVSCTRISSPLTLPTETVTAYVDADNREVGLHQDYVDRMDNFAQNPTRADLLPILTVIAHEKRHVTLGSAVNVDPANLQPDFSSSQAGQAAYRVEEIMTVAEEIAISRRFRGRRYSVPVTVQTQLRRYWNTIKAWVTEAEAERLRGVIIQQLRRRYGTDPSCDDSITLGVIKSMETGRWHFCDTGTGRVAGTVPRGLNLCEQDGRHRVCGPADS